MVISAVLLPNKEDSQQLVNLSETINGSAESLIKLGKGSLPHITVTQFLAPEEETQNLWQAVQGLSKTVEVIISGGLSFVPDSHEASTWVELSVLKSSALSQLQENILATNFAERFELHNGRGDIYRPHCTLALLKGNRIPQMNLENFSLFKQEFRNLTLAVGVNGENFTFTEAQFS